jgi:hypothetical protein
LNDGSTQKKEPLQVRVNKTGPAFSFFIVVVSMPQAFRHVPLNHPWEIRLVELLPGNEDEDVALRLRVQPGRNAADVDPSYDESLGTNLVQYIALSYTWGDPTDTVPILLNGETFHIRKNLYLALWQFRLPPGHGSLFYWIDAICINQEDAEERNTQVRRMGRIYENAKEIYVWLGPAAHDSHLAIQKINTLGEYVKQQGLKTEFDQDDVSKILGPSESPFNGRPWIALQRLLERPWWTRIWVVQESTIERVPTYMMCGNRCALRSNVLAACALIVSMRQKQVFEMVNNYKIETVKVMKLGAVQLRRYVGGTNLQLLNLLKEFRDFQATDPRDKVYAVVGITTDAQLSNHLQPD